MYVPTTPNPTVGYFMIVPRSQVRELDMTVDEALKYIISMGVVAPRGSRSAPRARAAARRDAGAVTAPSSTPEIDRARRAARTRRDAPPGATLPAAPPRSTNDRRRIA